jgi:hypothetical protein
MKIIRIDQENHERVVESGITDRKVGIEKMVALARKECARLPNNPTLDQCGVDEIEIRMTYRIASYRLAS